MLAEEELTALTEIHVWVMVVAVLSWCSVVYGLFVGLPAFSQLSSNWKLLENEELQELFERVGAGLLALYLFYPCLKLTEFAKHLRDLRHSRELKDIEGAFREERHYWRYCYLSLMIIPLIVILTLALLYGP